MKVRQVASNGRARALAPTAYTSPLADRKRVKSDFGTKDARMQALMQQHSALFEDADTDGDQRLSFQEFYLALPLHIREHHPLSEVVAWFTAIDTSGDGAVCLNEFFTFSLRASALGSGTGILRAFELFDENHDGRLSEHA